MKKIVLILAILGLFWGPVNCQRYNTFSSTKYLLTPSYSGWSSDRIIVASPVLKSLIAVMAEMETVTVDDGVYYLPEDGYYPVSEEIIPAQETTEINEACNDAIEEALRQFKEALKLMEEMRRRQLEIMNSITR